MKTSAHARPRGRRRGNQPRMAAAAPLAQWPSHRAQKAVGPALWLASLGSEESEQKARVPSGTKSKLNFSEGPSCGSTCYQQGPRRLQVLYRGTPCPSCSAAQQASSPSPPGPAAPPAAALPHRQSTQCTVAGNPPPTHLSAQAHWPQERSLKMSGMERPLARVRRPGARRRAVLGLTACALAEPWSDREHTLCRGRTDAAESANGPGRRAALRGEHP